MHACASVVPEPFPPHRVTNSYIFASLMYTRVRSLITLFLRNQLVLFAVRFVGYELVLE